MSDAGLPQLAENSPIMTFHLNCILLLLHPTHHHRVQISVSGSWSTASRLGVLPSTSAYRKHVALNVKIQSERLSKVHAHFPFFNSTYFPDFKFLTRFENFG